MNKNIEKIEFLDKEIYLVKTAHVSKNSVEDVITAFNEIEPDAICVELDDERYQTIKNKEKWRDQDIIDIIKNKQVGFLLVNIILSSFQKRMANKMDNTSGQEMITGVELALNNKKELILADRSIKVTFKRIWNKLSLKERVKLIFSIISAIFEDEELSEEDLENLKNSDTLEAAINEVGRSFPVVKQVLIDERDQYLSHMIKKANGKRIIAIIGAGHANGIRKYISKDIEIDNLNSVDKKIGLTSFMKWGIPILILSIIGYTLLTSYNVGLNQIKIWFLYNGTFSAIGSIIALSHPLTILTAFFLAPFTSLNPLLAVGWFAGIVEATIRKPKVKDFEDLTYDTSSLRGFWKNRITRILLIVILTNIFSTIATFLSGIDIFKSFISIFK